MSAEIRMNRTDEVVKEGFATYSDALTFLSSFYDPTETYIHDHDWRDRERARPNLLDLTPFGLNPIEDHFLHITDTTSSTVLVGYTPDEKKGARNRQARHVRIGSYLVNFYPDLTSDDVTRLSNEIAAVIMKLEIKFATTREEIRQVYENSGSDTGTYSCMSGSGRWSFDEHPVEAYAAGDLAVAYLERDGKTLARTVVWPEKKVWVRLFGGEHEKLAKLLKDQGYRQGGIDGARLLKIVAQERPNYTRFVCPYIDGPHHNVSMKGDYLVVDPNGTDTSEYGLVHFELVTCHKTGRRMFSGEAQLIHSSVHGDGYYIANDVFDETEFWKDPQYGFYYDRHSMIETGAGPVPRYFADNYMETCVITGMKYPMERTQFVAGLGYVNTQYYLTNFAMCQMTQRPMRKTDMVWMEHGAWWCKAYFENHGVTVDGRNYANVLREAA